MSKKKFKIWDDKKERWIDVSGNLRQAIIFYGLILRPFKEATSDRRSK